MDSLTQKIMFKQVSLKNSLKEKFLRFQIPPVSPLTFHPTPHSLYPILVEERLLRQPKARVCFSPPTSKTAAQWVSTLFKDAWSSSGCQSRRSDGYKPALHCRDPWTSPTPNWLISRGQGHQCEKFLLEIFSRCDWQWVMGNAMGDFCCCSVKKKLLQLIACRKSFIKSRNRYNIFKLQCRILKHF